MTNSELNMAASPPAKRKRNVTKTSMTPYHGRYSVDAATSPNKRYTRSTAALMASAPHSRSYVDHGAVTKPFPFLKLPGELRNKIYSQVGDGDFEAYLDPQYPGKLMPASPALFRVSKQIHNEYLDAVYLRADIIARVVDFDFAHVITFIDNLAERARNTLPHINPSSTRNIIILLDITEDLLRTEPSGLSELSERSELSNAIGGQLEYWIDYLQIPTRADARMVVSYKVQLPPHLEPQRTFGRNGRKEDPPLRLACLVRDLQFNLVRRAGGWTEQKKGDLRGMVKAMELATNTLAMCAPPWVALRMRGRISIVEEALRLGKLRA